MRIAQIAPLAEAVPPKLYGGTERVVWWLTEAIDILNDSGEIERVVTAAPHRSGKELSDVSERLTPSSPLPPAGSPYMPATRWSSPPSRMRLGWASLSLALSIAHVAVRFTILPTLVVLIANQPDIERYGCPVGTLTTVERTCIAHWSSVATPEWIIMTSP